MPWPDSRLRQGTKSGRFIPSLCGQSLSSHPLPYLSRGWDLCQRPGLHSEFQPNLEHRVPAPSRGLERRDTPLSSTGILVLADRPQSHCSLPTAGLPDDYLGAPVSALARGHSHPGLPNALHLPGLGNHGVKGELRGAGPHSPACAASSHSPTLPGQQQPAFSATRCLRPHAAAVEPRCDTQPLAL